MGRPRKATVDSFFDVFASFPLSEQAIIVRVMDRLVMERVKDAQGARRAPAAEDDVEIKYAPEVE